MEKDVSGLVFFIAEHEKAIVDFCYLNLKKFHCSYRELFHESYRLQNLETLKTARILRYAKLFDNEKLVRVSKSLIRLVDESRSAQ